MFGRDEESQCTMSNIEFVTRFFGIPTIVTPFAVVIEGAIGQLQLGKSDVRGAFRGNKSLPRALGLALQQSIVKGGLYATRKPLGETFENLTGFKKQRRLEGERNWQSWGMTAAAYFGFPATTTLVYTWATQYHANLRAQLTMPELKDKIKPFRKNTDYIRYSVQGFLPRWSRDMLGFSFLTLTQPEIKKYLDSINPDDEVVNTISSYAVSGGSSAYLGTPLDIFWRKGLSLMDFANFTVPPMREIARTIFRESSWRGFYRSSPWCALYAASMYSIFGCAEYAMDNFVFAKTNPGSMKETPLAPRFFSAAAVTREDAPLERPEMRAPKI